MKLYNSLTRTLDELPLPSGGPLRLFVCGPTVYDDAHIGHARTYLVFDMLVRALRAERLEVSYLQNITDIDDRIIARAHERKEHPLAFARRYETRYREDMEALAVVSVDTYARASDHLTDIVNQVRTLMEKGHAYRLPGDGIYFDVTTFPGYGKLAGRTAAQAEDAESRIDDSVAKKNRADFCLWKFPKRAIPDSGAPYELRVTDDGEPVWHTPLGWGRPGWHIEDTAITEHYYGPQYDVHGGGIDIKFPHHEAEIAQQEAASGRAPFVKHWIHTGHLLVGGKKMSKSLGNFITVREFLTDHHPDLLRWLVLKHHYRAPMNYTEDLLANADTELAALREFLAKLSFVETRAPRHAASDGTIAEAIAASERALREALGNDFMTPLVVAHWFSFMSGYQDTVWRMGRAEAGALRQHLEDWLTKLGFSTTQSEDDPADVIALAEKRELSRGRKQFIEADALRDRLRALGYVVDDTPLGPWVRRVSSPPYADHRATDQTSPAGS